MSDHLPYMRTALALARRNLGQTWPNPSVGAVIVKDGTILAQGVTARGGRPHAETQALAQAGAEARGATLYVTLEPCAHQGKTPPCTRAIIEAGIARVVMACRDPHTQVNGLGIGQLHNAGIEVIESVGEVEAREVNRGFFSVVQKQRPYIAVKIASSLDGKVACPPSMEGMRWITGESARAYGHLLRSRYDAIATGIGTVLADDPLLTCRLPGLEHRSPVRIVFDRQGRLPPSSQLARTAHDIPVWVITPSSRRKPGSSLPHITRIELDPGFRRDDELWLAVQSLAHKGITRLLVEAGPVLTTAFVRSGLVDRIYWFRAPLLIGSGGLAAMDDGCRLTGWRCIAQRSFPPDSLEILECSPASSTA